MDHPDISTMVYAHDVRQTGAATRLLCAAPNRRPSCAAPADARGLSPRSGAVALPRLYVAPNHALGVRGGRRLVSRRGAEWPSGACYGDGGVVG